MPRYSVNTQITEKQHAELKDVKAKLEEERGKKLSDYEFYREMLLRGCRACNSQSPGEEKNVRPTKTEAERGRSGPVEISY